MHLLAAHQLLPHLVLAGRQIEVDDTSRLGLTDLLGFVPVLVMHDERHGSSSLAEPTGRYYQNFGESPVFVLLVGAIFKSFRGLRPR